MAILQSRMIALINAALDYQRAFRQVERMIQSELTNIQQGRQTPGEAFYNLAHMVNESRMLQDMAGSQHSISSEHYHFEKNRKRNEERRRYQENKRGQTTRQFYEPQHAVKQGQDLTPLTIPFRAEGQNKRGDIPRDLYTPHGLSPEAKWEIENRPPSKEMTPEQEEEYRRFLERIEQPDIPKGEDPFKGSLNSPYDPNFDFDNDKTE